MPPLIEGIDPELILAKFNFPAVVPGVALWDLDGTSTRGLAMTWVFEDQINRNCIPESSKHFVTDLSGLINDYNAGQMGKYSSILALNQVWAQICKEMPFQTLYRLARESTDNKRFFLPYVSDSVEMIKDRGYAIILMTAEPQFVAKAVTEKLGLTGYYSTTWKTATKDGIEIVTGEVDIATIMSAQRKGVISRYILARNHFNPAMTIAFADSDNDCEMAREAVFTFVCGTGTRRLIECLERNRYIKIDPEQPEQTGEIIKQVISRLPNPIPEFLILDAESTFADSSETAAPQTMPELNTLHPGN